MSNEQLKKENQSLRMHNTIMMDKEFSHNHVDPDYDVYWFIIYLNIHSINQLPFLSFFPS